jgi:Zeta toxin
MFQDAVIDHFLKAAVIKDKNGELCTTPTEPWIVFTAGAMGVYIPFSVVCTPPYLSNNFTFVCCTGAGKSHTMRILVENGHFPLLAFVNVDPDRIRYFIPEFHIYLEQNAELAGELTRKEAGFIAEILTLAGLHAGKNVLVDGSLRDHNWYKQYFARLRADFPGIRIAILHVTAPKEAVFQRAEVRIQVG